MSFYTQKYLLRGKDYILKSAFFDRYFTEEMSILDVGCSVGNFIVFNPKKIIGIDIDKDAIKITKERGFEVYLYNIEEMPINDLWKEKFDAIHIGGTLEHSYFPDKIIGNCLRLLKKGGKLVVNVPNMRKISIQEFYWDYTHKTPYTRESLIALAQNHKLKIIGIEEETNYSIRGLNRLYQKFPGVASWIARVFKGKGIIGVFEK